jgi:uroporphyrinogen-III synthase
VTFTSGSSVEAFERLVPAHGLHGRAAAVCIGPVTAQAAARTGWRRIVTAGESTVEGLVTTLGQTLRGGERSA